MERKGVLIISGLVLLGLLSFLFDLSIANFFNSSLNPIFVSVLSLLRPAWFYVILAIVIMFLLVIKHKRKWIKPFIFTVFFTAILSLAIKFVVMRPRPLGLLEYLPFTQIMDYSFPSSHAAVIFSILPLLDEELKHYKLVWIILAVLVAFSRVYFNVHYLSDVIFGALLGYLIGYVIMRMELRNKSVR